MPKVFISKGMKYTPFGGFHAMDLPYLETHGITITTNIKEADVLVAQHRKFLKPYFLKYRSKKKYLIWTLEPRFDESFSGIRKELFGLVTCHIMNLYTRDVFVSPLSFHIQLIDKQLPFLPADFKLASRKVIGLMSHFAGLDTPPLIHEGKDIDLIKVRTKIALEGYKKNAFVVHGKGWPVGVAAAESRSGDWKTAKKEIMNAFHFNLCFENTHTFNYISEKIWDSIENNCLPIYFGGDNGIYNLFPKNSFIDYALLESPESLFEMIDQMSDAEYVRRMNACTMVYNEIEKKGSTFAAQQRALAIDAIANKINKITAEI